MIHEPGAHIQKNYLLRSIAFSLLFETSLSNNEAAISCFYYYAAQCMKIHIHAQLLCCLVYKTVRTFEENYAELKLLHHVEKPFRKPHLSNGSS